jgi:hypothetical protein
MHVLYVLHNKFQHIVLNKIENRGLVAIPQSLFLEAGVECFNAIERQTKV